MMWLPRWLKGYDQRRDGMAIINVGVVARLEAGGERASSVRDRDVKSQRGGGGGVFRSLRLLARRRRFQRRGHQ